MNKISCLIIVVTLAGALAQVDEYEKAIADIFTTPNTDFLTGSYVEVTTTERKLEVIERCGEGKDKGVHLCVPYFNCDAETNTIIPQEEYDGTGLIDIRFGSNTCENYLDVCCKVPSGKPIPPEVTTKEPGEIPTPKPPVTPPPDEPAYCGIRNPNGVDFKITGNNANEAEYGEFPWMLAILNKNYISSSKDPLAICGGSLIAPNVVLTGAHCVFKYKTEDLTIRAGEWDAQTERERYPYQERNVKDIIVHDGFTSNNLFNDVALLILDRPFDRAPHIGTICLPYQNQVFYSKECYASGWGKNFFGLKGQYQVILKKIKLPIVQKPECQDALRETRLGSKFKLHESFTCAGGDPGVDTCTGDGGSPLVCPDPNNPKRYVQAGMVAWGIGCGETGVPGVYVDVAYFREWIDQQLKRLNIDGSSYIV